MLDLGREVGTPGDPLDGLTDDYVEAAARSHGLVQQVLDAAVARDRDLELLVRVPTAPVRQIHAAGLDVVEVRDDHRMIGERPLTAAEWARQRQRGVLLIIRRRPPGEGHADELRAGIGWHSY